MTWGTQCRGSDQSVLLSDSFHAIGRTLFCGASE